MGAMRAVAAGGGAYTSARRAKADRKVAKATVEKQEARVSKARRVSGGQHFTKLSESPIQGHGRNSRWLRLGIP